MMAKKTGRNSRSVVTARRGPSLTMIVGIVVVLLFAGVVGFGVYRTQHQSGTGAVPANASASGVTVGQASAPATVDIYLDFQCPVCREYEQQSGPTLDGLIASGAAKVVYHPLAFLDRFSSTKYSTRASEASGCIAQDGGPGVFAKYLKLLYANQPPENGDGLPESQLISLGQQAGAGPNFAGCVSANTFAGWTAALTDAASKAGIDATPTVQVNGKQIDNTDAALQQAVQAAK
ncbi:MAG TPA: thioredoxin domain-containing protein [Pseudonocardia sp.]|jgi:protein-disulfide isomerase|nr:thioredoxin domain-containing protein [Pseudonocardia sp.]